MGFHADQEAMRVLALSLEAARLGQVMVREPAYRPTVTAESDPLQPHTAAQSPTPHDPAATPAQPSQKK